ncbi:MAG: hypothetical protein IPL46_21285 [Saprospiraceae bacterium]|nr:hypothetical protein [Saprospiraceae bacterium]
MYNYDDVTPPETPVLGSVTIDCEGVLIAPTTTDVCAGVITGTTMDVLDFVEGGSTTITWTFSDGNGNSTSAMQVYNYDDVTPPMTPTLSPVTVDCEGILTAPMTTDVCAGPITGTTTDVLSFVEGSSTTIEWTFDDGNGNSTSAMQVYNYDDVTPPVTPILSPVTVDCEGTLIPPTTTDNCVGIVTGSTTDELDFVEPGSTEITWTFDDGNGNSTMATQMYIYDDVTAPITPTIDPVTVDCDPNLATPVTFDVCAGMIAGTMPGGLVFVDGTTVTVTWTFNDGNGNSTTTDQMVTFDDAIDPVPDLATLPDITTECEVTGLTPPSATDVCAGAITGTHNALLPITTQGTTVVTWTYDDGNGNMATQTQNVVIDDVTPPTLGNCPSDQSVTPSTITCSYLHGDASWDVTATDNCGATVYYTLSGATSSMTNEFTTLDGVEFSEGVTTITVIAIDIGDNPSSSCQFYGYRNLSGT